MNLILFALFTTTSWVNECEQLVTREVIRHNPKHLEELVRTIPQSIHLANLISEQERSPKENLDRCALAVAIAKRESYFNPRIRNRTALGLYQILPSTAKWILKDNWLVVDAKSRLLEPLAAGVIFNLLLDDFFMKYKSVFRVLVRYNTSPRISKEILGHYKKIQKEIQWLDKSTKSKEEYASVP